MSGRCPYYSYDRGDHYCARLESKIKSSIGETVCDTWNYTDCYIKESRNSAYDLRQEYADHLDDDGCYVATAVYGSYDCPEVWTLRRFRDYTLKPHVLGRAFVKVYYAISPTLVKWFGHTEWFRKLWKGKLDRMVAKLNAKGVENTPYEDP